MKMPDYKLLELPAETVRDVASALTHRQYIIWSIITLQDVIRRMTDRGGQIYTGRGMMLLRYRQDAVEFFMQKLGGYYDEVPAQVKELLYGEGKRLLE